jgi:hypothetical protein
MVSDAATATRVGEGSTGSDGGNAFDSKMDKGSADLYFHYYGMLQHQQNMLQVSVPLANTGGGGRGEEDKLAEDPHRSMSAWC